MASIELWLQRRSFVARLHQQRTRRYRFRGVAGPYIAALSHQKHRFDFGDSGALNYAWYVGGVEKMHLEPWMTSSFGPATVHLIHPEQQLLASPGIYSYRAEPYGTYPDWFDTTYFNERIIPHLDPPVLIKPRRAQRRARCALPLQSSRGLDPSAAAHRHGRTTALRELAPRQLLAADDPARPRDVGTVRPRQRRGALRHARLPRRSAASLRCVAHTTAGSRRVRHNTVLLAALCIHGDDRAARASSPPEKAFVSRSNIDATKPRCRIPGTTRKCSAPRSRCNNSACSPATKSPAWAVMRASTRTTGRGWRACAFSRRSTTPTANSSGSGPACPIATQVLDILRAQNAKVLVAQFDPASLGDDAAAAQGWIRLDDTDLYAYPLTLRDTLTPGARHASATSSTLPWNTTREGGP